jgi:LPS export ABC transporter protein LptC
MKNYSSFILFNCFFQFTKFLLLIGLVGGLLSCEKTRRSLGEMKPYDGPTIKTFDLAMTFTDSAKLQIEMKTPLRLEFENGNQDYPKSIEVIFYNKLQQKQTVLTANRARYDKATNKYTATGNVIVKNLLKNERLNTEELNWTPNNQTIFTEKFVTITTDKEILKGNGMTARQDFTAYKITLPTGRFAIEK